ncbi:uncharacterized protein LOC142766810 [Rhipicephalus microplus]|uniref:uncharacterized protein LOC142766810 n=1 Tax=Rhipicephalus microplus TaxID=6941 RepID=UPI003F6BB598
MYQYPYIDITKIQKSKLETLLRQISRTILGTPHYAKSDRVQGTAILPNPDELTQIHREAQFPRLKHPAQGYALLRDLGYDISAPVAFEATRPPWATLNQITAEPVPRHMDRAMGESLKHIPINLRPVTLEEWLVDSSPDIMKTLLQHLQLLGLDLFRGPHTAALSTERLTLLCGASLDGRRRVGSLAAVLDSPDVVGWADAPGDTLRPAVGFFSRWARVDDDGVTCYGGDASGRRTATRWRDDDRRAAGRRTVAFASGAEDSASASEPDRPLLNDVRPNFRNIYHAGQKSEAKRRHKFLQKPKLAEDVGPDDFGSALFGSRVSLRTLAPTAPDAASLHTTAAAAATGPPLVPFLPPRSVLRGSFGRYQGPLSQWQIAADMYIDSDIRKRGRRKVVSHSSGEAKAPMAPVERVERRQDRPPAEPCPRRADVDRELGLPRRRLVLKGPLHATSYAHWYSRVFSPASSSNEDC